MATTTFQIFPRLCLKRLLPANIYDALMRLKWQCQRPLGQLMRHMARFLLKHCWPELYEQTLEKLLAQLDIVGVNLQLEKEKKNDLVEENEALKRRLRAEVGSRRAFGDHPSSGDTDAIKMLLDELNKLQIKTGVLKQENADLVELAARDPLTGLANRHALALQFETAVGGLMRELCETKPAVYISAVILDIDHFKKINDQWGHSAGDQVLMEMARRIKKYLGRRREDALAHIHARIGGEEFIVILPHADSENAFKQTTIRLLYEVRRTPFSVTVNNEQIEINLTVSAGVATLRLTPETVGKPDEQYQKLYEQADRALYVAKNPDAPKRGAHFGRDRAIRFDSLSMWCEE